MKRAEHQPTTDLTLYAGIYAKVWTIADRGTVLPQHAHEWDHISLIASGKVHIWQRDDYLGVYTAPAMVKIPARAFHRFETITDNVVIVCIHNADHIDADGEPAVYAPAHLELEE
jgi:hypothetical protein